MNMESKGGGQEDLIEKEFLLAESDCGCRAEDEDELGLMENETAASGFSSLAALEASLRGGVESGAPAPDLLEAAALEAEVLIDGGALLDELEREAEFDEAEGEVTPDEVEFDLLESELDRDPGTADPAVLISLAKQNPGLKITLSF